MSAVLTNPPTPGRQESPGLWMLAWRRLRHDGVGMVSLVVVAFFILLMAASYAGIVAGDWSKEKGVSYANPSFMAGAENLEAKAMAQKQAAAKSPPVDLSDIDPLAPYYEQWAERASKVDESRRLAQSKSDLVATLSHEIRNGLTGVAHVLSAAAGKSDTLQQYARDYPVEAKGPHDQPQSMCPAFGSLRVGLRMLTLRRLVQDRKPRLSLATRVWFERPLMTGSSAIGRQSA